MRPDPNPQLWELKPVFSCSVVLPPWNGEEGQEWERVDNSLWDPSQAWGCSFMMAWTNSFKCLHHHSQKTDNKRSPHHTLWSWHRKCSVNSCAHMSSLHLWDAICECECVWVCNFSSHFEGCEKGPRGHARALSSFLEFGTGGQPPGLLSWLLFLFGPFSILLSLASGQCMGSSSLLLAGFGSCHQTVPAFPVPGGWPLRLLEGLVVSATVLRAGPHVSSFNLTALYARHC